MNIFKINKNYNKTIIDNGNAFHVIRMLLVKLKYCSDPNGSEVHEVKLNSIQFNNIYIFKYINKNNLRNNSQKH